MALKLILKERQSILCRLKSLYTMLIEIKISFIKTLLNKTAFYMNFDVF